MIIADKIVSLRKRAGWSQEELAEKLGVTRQSVSKWEGAQSVPDMDKVVSMSRLFGVTTDYPDMQFRYCSKCAGYHCFCQDHIFNHVHFTEE